MILVKGLQRYQRSKLEVNKNICLLARFENDAPRAGCVGRYFFLPLTLTSDILQPQDQNKFLVPHLTVPIHTCLEPEILRLWHHFWSYFYTTKITLNHLTKYKLTGNHYSFLEYKKTFKESFAISKYLNFWGGY